MFCLFITFSHADAGRRVDESMERHLAGRLLLIDGLLDARILTPAVAQDRYYDDGPPPMLAFQLYFDRLESLECAAGRAGPLPEAVGSILAEVDGAVGTHQAMWSRPFPVPDAGGRCVQQQNEVRCAFMVHYHGEPIDANAWHSFYMAHHPPIMATFPGIREIEVCTRVDWIDALPTQRVNYFQRNKVVFDDPPALQAALSSPTREHMKTDRDKFPAFAGGSIHVPMLCRLLGHLALQV